jgi:hypothetical protein
MEHEQHPQHRCEAMTRLEAGGVIDHVEVYRSFITEGWYIQFFTRHAAMNVPAFDRCPFCGAELDKEAADG